MCHSRALDVTGGSIYDNAPDGYKRDGLRSDQARLPKETGTREALARQVGADGYPLLAWVQTAATSLDLRDLPALEALRQIWIQQYYRCTVPGLEAFRWRIGDAHPPAAVRLASPYDLEGLCRKFCSRGHEGAVGPVCGGVMPRGSRTAQPP